MELVQTDPVLESQNIHCSYELSDHGNALRLIDKFGIDIRYYNSNLGEGWFIWDGTTWCTDLKGNIHQKAKITINEMYNELPEIQDKIESTRVLKFILHSKNQRALINMIASAQNEPGVFVDKEVFDSHKDLINTMNGVVDLQTGTLSPHRRDLMLSKKIKFDYNPNAKCPRWEQFIKEITSNEDVAKYLQRFFGYCLTGHTSEQIFVIANGLGGNGKGTMTDTLMNIFGPYVRTAEPSTVIRKKYERSSSNDLADLFGYRLVVASETDPEQILDEGRVKRMTGEDRIKCRLLYREYFEYDPQFKLLLLTNHKPNIESQDFSIWRRIKRIDFDKKFNEDTADQQLRSTLLLEAPGILRWLIDGAIEWYKTGLNTPQIVTDATFNYKEEMDLIGGFLDICIDEDLTSRVKVKDLYDLYVLWSRFIEDVPLSKTAFGIKLGERGYTAKRSNGIFFRHGLTIKSNLLDSWTQAKEEYGSKVPISTMSTMFYCIYKSSYTSRNSTDSCGMRPNGTAMSPDTDRKFETQYCNGNTTQKPCVSMTEISGILNLIRTEWHYLNQPHNPSNLIDDFVGELIRKCKCDGREITKASARIFVINAYTSWGWPTY